MKLRTPWQIYKFIKERKNLEHRIDDYQRIWDHTFDNVIRIELNSLRRKYRCKYFVEYKQK